MSRRSLCIVAGEGQACAVGCYRNQKTLSGLRSRTMAEEYSLARVSKIFQILRPNIGKSPWFQERDSVQ